MDKLKRIVKAAFGVAASSNPALAGVVGIANAFLGDKNKIPMNATGEEVEKKLNTLPTDAIAEINRRVELEIVESNNFSANFMAACEADKSGSTYRPVIAMLMAVAIFLAVVLALIIIGYATYLKDAELIKEFAGAWALLGVVLAVPSAVLKAYFGLRSKEKTARYQMATGQNISPIGSILDIFKR